MLRRLLMILGLGAAYRSFARRRYMQRRPGLMVGMGAGGAAVPLLAWLAWKNRDKLTQNARRAVAELDRIRSSAPVAP